MIIYGLKNCDACKDLLKVEPDFELFDVSITPVPENILEKAIENFGEALINKRSLTWRKLDIETRQKQAQLDVNKGRMSASNISNMAVTQMCTSRQK